MKNEFTIGVLGGMGTYATIHIFKQYAQLFSAAKEWERPRIIIDNRCTMPSRVDAYVNGRKRDILVNMMIDSLVHLDMMGCDYIILGCFTSHLFIPEILDKYPDITNKIVNLVELCTDQIIDDGKDEVYLLASEGTIESKIFQKVLDRKSRIKKVNCISPDKKDYPLLRECIEAVKQNIYSPYIQETFLSLVNRSNCSCILGCTELPILYEKYLGYVSCDIYDPMMLGLSKINLVYSEGKKDE